MVARQRAQAVLLALGLILVGCPVGTESDEPTPINAGDVHATGEVTVMGAIQAGAVTAGAVAAGDVAAGDVVAGGVTAGDVEAGVVQAGVVQAAEVNAGDVLAGEVTAGDVTSTGAVELTGPITATVALGVPASSAQVVVSQCNPNSGCPSLAAQWTADVQAACVGGTVAAIQAYPNQIDAVNTIHTLVALVDCP